MHFREPVDNSYWHCVVYLNEQEWPDDLDPEGLWLARPIRKWVDDHCEDNVFFTYYGVIYFQSGSDFVRFWMTWSNHSTSSSSSSL